MKKKWKVQQDVNKYQENVTEAVVLVKTFWNRFVGRMQEKKIPLKN